MRNPSRETKFTSTSLNHLMKTKVAALLTDQQIKGAFGRRLFSHQIRARLTTKSSPFDRNCSVLGSCVPRHGRQKVEKQLCPDKEKCVFTSVLCGRC